MGVAAGISQIPLGLREGSKNNHDSDKTKINLHSEDFRDKTNFLPTFVNVDIFPSDAVLQRAYKIGCVEMLFGILLASHRVAWPMTRI